MKRRHAILLDGGFVLKRLRGRLGRPPEAADVHDECGRIGQHPRLALLHLVDAVVVVTADRDLVPAFRFVRREGLRVYVDHLGAKSVHRDLIAHADRVL